MKKVAAKREVRQSTVVVEQDEDGYYGMTPIRERPVEAVRVADGNHRNAGWPPGVKGLRETERRFAGNVLQVDEAGGQEDRESEGRPLPALIFSSSSSLRR